ncbi:PREDICTED: uncharacterized protein At3g43530-like [Camelina sativa]|uniref:Uncharacterized protein At3g43530-like n=1 Tax=Camelina sativa TaxID=90675 RepID=A0ABM1RKW0_CAMSA|nr:PREDICTED: uncharacterized protein At3g43530-like [Camelina sativa]
MGEDAPSVESFFYRAVGDLELCKSFPWGRFAYDANMKDLFHIMHSCGGVVGPRKVFPSFVTPLELLGHGAIPALKNNFQEIEIQSIIIPSPDEKVLMKKIMDHDCGWNDVDDAIAEGWTKRLVKEKKTICFENMHKADVASRAVEANLDASNLAQENIGETKQGRKKVARTKVALKKVNNGLDEVEKRLMKVLNSGFEKMNVNFDFLDTRLKILEENVKQLKEGKEVVEATKNVMDCGDVGEDEEVSEATNNVADCGDVGEDEEVAEDEGVAEDKGIAEDEVVVQPLDCEASKEMVGDNGKEVGEEGEASNKIKNTYKRKTKMKKGTEEVGQDDGEMATTKVQHVNKRRRSHYDERAYQENVMYVYKTG